MARSMCLLCGEGHSVILMGKKVSMRGRGAVADLKTVKQKQLLVFPKNDAAVTGNPPIL